MGLVGCINGVWLLYHVAAGLSDAILGCCMMSITSVRVGVCFTVSIRCWLVIWFYFNKTPSYLQTLNESQDGYDI